MAFFGASLVKELGRLRNDPWRVAYWVVIPVVLGGLLSAIAGGPGGGQGLSPTPVVVVDEDGTLVSRLFAAALGQGGMAEVLEVVSVPDADSARQRVVDGKASAALIVPSGFQTAVLQETSAELLVVTNPAEQIRPKIAVDVVEILTDLVFYAHRILGEEIRSIVTASDTEEGSPADPFVADVSVRINQALRRVEGLLLPPRLRVETASAAPADPEVPGEASSPADDPVPIAFYFLPGVVLMGLVFMAAGLSEDFWREREGGTLRRYRTTPRGLAALVLAKTSMAALAALGLSVVLLGLGTLIYGHGVGAIPGALLWCVLVAVVFFLGMGALQLVASSPRAGSVVVNLMLFPLLMIGGSFFPFQAMPDVLVAVGRWTPNGIVVRRVESILLGRSAPGVEFELTVLLTLAVVFASVVVLRLRRVDGGSA
jgi:ABC-type multidrug transport system permease subunit